MSVVSFPFVDVTLGNGKYLGNYKSATDPRFLESFTMVKKSPETDPSNSSWTATFTFNQMVLQNTYLERDIINYISDSNFSAKVKFKYGFTDGVKSPLYEGTIVNLNVSNGWHQVTIKVEGCTAGDSTNMSEFTKDTLSYFRYKKFFRYSDIVQAIAEGQKWNVGRIVKTTEHTEPIAINATVGTNAIDYIKNYLSPYAVAEDGSNRFQLVIRNEGTGTDKYGNTVVTKGTVYWLPTNMISEYQIRKNYNFSINLLPDGVVSDWSPNINMNATAEASFSADADNKAWMSVITTDSKEVVSLEKIVSLDNKSSGITPIKNTVSKVSNKQASVNASASDISNASQEYIANNINEYAYSIYGGMSGTLKIIGDPELEVMDHVNVIPMYNDNYAGIMHPTGGTYMIETITDTISGGSFTTSLSLVKDSSQMMISEGTKIVANHISPSEYAIEQGRKMYSDMYKKASQQKKYNQMSEYYKDLYSKQYGGS